MKILMVCLGNICRSPLAEGIMASKLTGRLTDFHVDSAGTGSWHAGDCPDKRSIKVAKKYGIDISTQKARQFTTADFEAFDLIFTMDHEVQRFIERMARTEDEKRKVILLLSWAGRGNEIVPDPYYDGDEAFESVYTLLDHACSAVAARLSKESEERAGRKQSL